MPACSSESFSSYVFLFFFFFYESRSSLFLNGRLVRRRTKKCRFGKNCFVERDRSVMNLVTAAMLAKKKNI